MSQQSTLGKIATTIRKDGANTIIRYHDTDVVSFNADAVTLNTGGWFTATTKTRMNQTAAQFDLPYRVYQSKGEWYAVLSDNGNGYQWDNPIPFTGNILTLPR